MTSGRWTEGKLTDEDCARLKAVKVSVTYVCSQFHITATFDELYGVANES